MLSRALGKATWGTLGFLVAGCGSGGDNPVASGDGGFTVLPDGAVILSDPLDAGSTGDSGLRSDAGVREGGSGGGDAGPSGTDAGHPNPDGGSFAGANALGAGGDDACVIVGSGALKCWGSANGDPQILTPGSTYTDVSVGMSGAACAIRTGNTLWCWNSPAQAPAQRDTGAFRHVAAGSTHFLAVSTGGSLFAWGNNTSGQLGTGNTTYQPNLVQVGTDSDWGLVSAGGIHSCGIKSSGSLYCWGANNAGQLGDGTTNQAVAPIPIAGAVLWSDISVGANGTCGVQSDGSLTCWGYYATSGGGTRVPTAIDTAKDWKKVRLGTTHGCALKQSGALYCWGQNAEGQLGAGDTLPRLSPTQVGTDVDYTDIAVGTSFSCASKLDGSVRCWGSDANGQLGRGLPDHTQPTAVGADWKHVAAGMATTCGVKNSGELYCWGQSGSYFGAQAQRTQVPVRVGAASDWASVAVGSSHACARKTDNALYCWGYSYDGALGLGQTSNAADPTSVGIPAIQVSLGIEHTCAVHSDLSLYCWGEDIFGRLGFDPPSGNQMTPGKVGTATWAMTAAGDKSTCSIKNDGTIWCSGFGYNDPAEQVSLETTWSFLATHPNSDDYFGIRGGGLYRWIYYNDPTPVGAETNWKTIAVGASHQCALRNDNTLACQGTNAEGQLGDGTRITKNGMTNVGAGADWSLVAVGGAHTCGIRNAGELYCWGSNAQGQIGDGSAWATTPQFVK